MSDPSAAAGCVPNAYKHAVRRAAGAAAQDAEVVAGVLDRARLALEAGAWISTSSAADDFAAGVHHGWQTLHRARDEICDEFDTALHREPDEVPAESWKARWR